MMQFSGLTEKELPSSKRTMIRDPAAAVSGSEPDTTPHSPFMSAARSPASTTRVPGAGPLPPPP
eukprot:CAMPEP_0198681682 /NCGR_PEP_ID=MMETSP1468-20131203/7280_1 /TAXON_ID=1461545 /ORGANISM="Mantoniella sp, Strain CCMP1436" /LENGTH=63 /DNA_ID=CAMNT_0044423733 /DNA_START=122 /DNA_END=310 /DNA_ORIENTATION=-